MALYRLFVVVAMVTVALVALIVATVVATVPAVRALVTVAVVGVIIAAMTVLIGPLVRAITMTVVIVLSMAVPSCMWLAAVALVEVAAVLQTSALKDAADGATIRLCLFDMRLQACWGRRPQSASW